MAMKFVVAGACVLALAAAAPLSAFADDPTATPDHSGKQVDGKTNGITPQTADTVKTQEKEQPAVNGSPGPSDAPVANPQK